MADGHEHVHTHEHSDKKDEALLREVGAFSYKALQKAASLVKPGAKLLDVANELEKFVKEGGFDSAFPLNLSVNNEAAHYTPSFEDEKVFGNTDLVKVDFGAAKNGILGDCAVTVDLSQNNQKLVDASKSALENALTVVKAGRKVCDIGKEIGRTITDAGFLPIINLGGHGVETHDLHSGVFIPNYDNGDDTELEEDMTIAIEPFATDSKKNEIFEGDVCEIYQFVGETPVRLPYARTALEEIKKNYNSEPFAARWLSKHFDSRFSLYAGLNALVQSGAIMAHPVLMLNQGLISQAEVEVIVQKDGCEVLTK